MPLVRHKIKRYGRVADAPDQRDHLSAAPIVQLKKLPPKVDLRPQWPKVIYDQRQPGSCTGNAIACAIQFDRLKQKLRPDFVPSRLFICYNERDMEGPVACDSGAQIRDGIIGLVFRSGCQLTLRFGLILAGDTVGSGNGRGSLCG